MPDTPVPDAAVRIGATGLPGPVTSRSAAGASFAVCTALARAGWLHHPAEWGQLDAENLRLREQCGDMAEQIEELRASLRDEVRKVIRLTAEVATHEADLLKIEEQRADLAKRLFAQEAELERLRAVSEAAGKIARKVVLEGVVSEHADAMWALRNALDALPAQDTAAEQ